jgi:formate--tetrahydrofolate ligase
MATKMALKLAEWVVTEAGFGADLGAEKFIDIKCRSAGLKPDAVVLVATVRSLKMHGGAPKDALKTENLTALQAGACNLARHIHNVTQVYGLPCVVALNRFASDTPAEIEWLRHYVADQGVELVLTNVHAEGGKGGEDLARAVQRAAERPNQFAFVYGLELSATEKIRAIAHRVYGAEDIQLSKTAQQKLKEIAGSKFAHWPVCVAKTPYSFSDDPTRLGAPEGWSLQVRDVRVAGGAGFLVALAGDVMTMPGLPAVPAATGINISPTGAIRGLF